MLRSVSPPTSSDDRPEAADDRLVGLKDDMLRRMRIVKRARFDAHGRLERKSNFSLFTLAMFALYGIAISLYPALFEDRFNREALRVLTFVSIISSIFIIIVTFIEALNDYRVKGLALQQCAIDVNRLMQRLETTSIATLPQLRWFSEKYNHIIDGCPYNHSSVDYQRALASERERKEGKTLEDHRFIYWRILRYELNIYALPVTLLLAPLGLLLLPT